MTTENNDKLDDAQLSSLYKQTQSELPPQHIDKRILTAAKRASTKHSTGPFGYSWRVPASVAAVLVISFGLVSLMQDGLIINDNQPTAVIEEDIAFVESAPAPAGAPVLDATQAPEVRLKPAQRSLAAKRPAPALADVEKLARKRTMEQRRKSNTSKPLAFHSAPAKINAEQFDVAPTPTIERIRRLRLAGHIDAANQAADEFINIKIGSQLDTIDIQQVTLTKAEWRALITELRLLERNSLADKLEKLIPVDLKN